MFRSWISKIIGPCIQDRQGCKCFLKASAPLNCSWEWQPNARISGAWGDMIPSMSLARAAFAQSSSRARIWASSSAFVSTVVICSLLSLHADAAQWQSPLAEEHPGAPPQGLADHAARIRPKRYVLVV